MQLWKRPTQPWDMPCDIVSYQEPPSMNLKVLPPFVADMYVFCNQASVCRVGVQGLSAMFNAQQLRAVTTCGCTRGNLHGGRAADKQSFLYLMKIQSQ